MTNYQTDLIANDLVSAGMKAELAKKVAYAIQAQGLQDLSHLASKDDLKELKNEFRVLRSEFREDFATKDYLKSEISELEVRLLKWLTWGGIILFGTIISTGGTLYYFLKPFIQIIP